MRPGPPAGAARRTLIAVSSALGVLLGGCGLNVTSADLFVLTRTEAGRTLTVLVNDGGTVRCDGGKPRALPDRLLISARDLAQSLDSDARARLSLAAGPGSVASYTVRLADGTLRFPDTAAAAHRELGQAELLALQIAQGPCAGATGA